MRILTPLAKIDDLKELIPLGADEFYFGMTPSTELTEIEYANFRPYNWANLKSVEEVKEASKIIHDAGLKCFFTLNTDLYSKKLLDRATKTLEAISNNIDGVILADAVLIDQVHKLFPNIKIITSTRCNSFNTWNIKFYKDLGAKRFTLPAFFYFKDMLKVLEKFPDIELEVFVKNDGCTSVTGMCSYIHNLNNSVIITSSEGFFCKCMATEARYFLHDRDKNESDKTFIKPIPNKDVSRKNSECKICLTKHLLGFKDRISLKISGRDHPLEKRKADLSFIKQSVKILEASNGDDVKKIPSLHKDIYGIDCFQKCGYKS